MEIIRSSDYKYVTTLDVGEDSQSSSMFYFGIEVEKSIFLGNKTKLVEY